MLADHRIAARLDRLPTTWLHVAVVVVCALGLLFDVVEAGLSNARQQQSVVRTT